MSQANNPFPNYTQIADPLPLPVWRVLRFAVLVLVGGLVWLLLAYPTQGLQIFWGAIIPLVPLLFFVVPGLWRNTCPMATMNQIPRLLGRESSRELSPLLKEYSYVFGIAFLFLAVPARKVFFNQDGTAVAALIGLVLALALLGGLLFKGKSGWCGTFCPLLPVQRMYGQTPFVMVKNSHCESCVGCTKNCFDFNPQVAYLADLYDDDKHYRNYRKFFVAAFPGLVYAFYTLPSVPEISANSLYLNFALHLLVSVGLYYFLDAFLKVSAGKITALFVAVALNLYYWFSVHLFLTTVGNLTDLSLASAPAIWTGQAAILLLTLFWLARSSRKEQQFFETIVGGQAVQIGSASALDKHRAASGENPELVIEPEGQRLVVTPGRSLLEIIENADIPIQPGCRMGVCGADPIRVLAGYENLSPMSDDERSTLARLGLKDNARMACCARVQGDVRITLDTESGETSTPSSADSAEPDWEVDLSVQHVVVVGNGIGGVTAADHVRRNHPDCEVTLIGREAHPLYNRMGISRLIYGSTAMQGLYLLPDTWYEKNRIEFLLNTHVRSVDPTSKQLLLATGEQIGYDRLILATGSRSMVPPIKGFDKPGCYVLREADDGIAIRQFAQQYQACEAVIAGGGLLGLEAAYALLQLGLHVTVLERGNRLLSRQLDEPGSRILERYLEGLGMTIEHGAEVVSVHGVERLELVNLKDKAWVQADLLLVCAGITPNIELALTADLEVNRGIIVDEHLRSSQPDIYAVGDSAEVDGRVMGLWPTAVEQGEVAAINALGGDRRYALKAPVTSLKVSGIDLTSLGQFEPEVGDHVVQLQEDGSSYRKLVIRDGIIVGAILIGHPLLTAAVSSAIKTERNVAEYFAQLEQGDWSALEG